jgi:hypothetical protein
MAAIQTKAAGRHRTARTRLHGPGQPANPNLRIYGICAQGLAMAAVLASAGGHPHPPTPSSTLLNSGICPHFRICRAKGSCQLMQIN